MVLDSPCGPRSALGSQVKEFAHSEPAVWTRAQRGFSLSEDSPLELSDGFCLSDVSAILSCRVSVRADVFFSPSVKMRVSGGESSNLNAEMLVPTRTRAGSEVFSALL